MAAAAGHSRRVSWAPDARLRQVRLFLSEDAPDHSRLVAQDHLQPRSSLLQHTAGIGPDDSLPPGFESPHSKCMINIPQIPLIKWQCPPKLSLHPQWEVVAGEESNEVVLEDQRLRGVLEALYPRPSSVPPNPVVSSEVEISFYDDSCTPSVPIIPVEDEKTTPKQPKQPTILTPDSKSPEPLKNTRSEWELETQPAMNFVSQLHNNIVPTSVCGPVLDDKTPTATALDEPDILAAASAAFTAIMRSHEEGSMIDQDLLISILSNPALLEKLLPGCGTKVGQIVANPHPSSTTALPPPPAPVVYPTTTSVPSSVNPDTTLALSSVNPPPTSVLVQRTSSKICQSDVDPSFDSPVLKDRNYYKSLVQEHGDPSEMHNSRHRNTVGVNYMEGLDTRVTQRDKKSKFVTPCIYFSSPMGCKRGASCFYHHDQLIQRQAHRLEGTKRTKLGRGIAR